MDGSETRLSDHASFWDAGLPALMVTDTAFFRNPNYHLPSDTLDTLDFTFMAQLVKSLELALLELPPAPTNSQMSPGCSRQLAPTCLSILVRRQI
jgi:Peptidase family M28